MPKSHFVLTFSLNLTFNTEKEFGELISIVERLEKFPELDYPKKQAGIARLIQKDGEVNLLFNGMMALGPSVSSDDFEFVTDIVN